jgi:hypothetical protein
MKGEKYIFAIAIDRYIEKSFCPLNNAKADVKRFVNVLSHKYGFKTIIGPLLDSHATRRSILEALNEMMSSLTKDDTLVIYHAGHGVIHPKTGKGFWIPHEAARTVGDWISHSEVIGYLEGFEVKHLCLITDSCFSGAFFSQTRGLNAFDSHYAKLSEFKSRWFLTSGREETVSDGKAGKGSPFANSLIKYLEENNSFPISELAIHVANETSRLSSQTPRWGAINSLGDEGGQLIFEVSIPEKNKKNGKKTWDENLAAFVKAKEYRAEWPYISKVNFETKELGLWCQDQRNNKRQGKLSKDREDKLLKAGFIFDPQIEKFFKGFVKFLAFMHKTGLNSVPTRLIKQYSSENAWHRLQQKWYSKAPCNPNNAKSYPEYRYYVLAKAGIPIESASRDEAWVQFEKDLIKYYEKHERLITIPSQVDKNKEVANLGKRVNDWMTQWKRNKLPNERIKFIEKYIDKDYKLNKIKRDFNKQIEEYLKFREEFPNENPSSALRARLDVKTVIDWKAQVNHRLSKGKLAIHKWKIDRLNEIGFQWTKSVTGNQTNQLELPLP